MSELEDANALVPLKERLVVACRQRAEQFGKILEEFEDQGILNSEMLAVCALSEDLGVDLVIESGRQRGHSTFLLARYFEGSGTVVVSVEKDRDENARYAEERLSRFEGGLDLLYGDGVVLVPELVERFADRRVAILLDGPKEEAAVRTAREALVRSPNVQAIFFHDAAPGSITRRLIERHFESKFFTDDPDYVREFEWLDEKAKPRIGQRIYPSTWVPYGRSKAYGPTLGIVLPLERERAPLPDVRLVPKEFGLGRYAKRVRLFVRLARVVGPVAAIRHAREWSKAKRKRRQSVL